MPNALAVVLNCDACNRRASEHRTRIVDLLKRSRIDAHLFCADTGDEIRKLTHRVAEQGYPVVVAAGGDGTVSAVASAIVGTDAALGVLPFGTVNHFAKSVGIPQTLEGALRTLEEGASTQIDVGQVNGHLFVNNSTFGVHPAIVRYRDELRRRHGLNKWVAYAFATAKLVPRREFPHVRLVTDDGEMQLQTPFVFVGNNDYVLGALDLGAHAAPGPGELGVGLARLDGKLPVLRLLGAAATKRLGKAKGFEHFRSRSLEVEVDAGANFLVALDGEVVEMAPPLRYRSRPDALRVIAPRRSDGVAVHEHPRRTSPPISKHA